MTASSTPIGEVVLEPPVARVAPSGTRSGVLLVAASGASIFANYVFLLAAGRILGSDRYGSLAALLGLLAVVLIPAGAGQMAVSREISRLVAAGNSDQADAFTRATLRLALLATLPLLALSLALAVPLADLLHIRSAGVVALAEFTFITSLVFPAAMGALQGRQRFHALAVLYIFPMVVRLALLAIVASAGYRLGGAVVATVAASIASTALAIALIRKPLRHGARFPRPSLRPFLRYLAPVSVGLVGIALLTHVDILVVKARFSAHDAGAYAAASAFARVAFFVPATILAVLFPRTAARQARGEQTEDILGRSLLATLAFCAALAVFYTATGTGLVTTTFGHDFANGGKILAPFAVAIGLFSIAQILVGYHLSRGETRYAWIVALGVLMQIAVLGVVPSTLRGIVWANVVIGAGLIAAHELFAESSVPAIRAGLRHFVQSIDVRIRHIAVEAGVVLFVTTALVCLLFWPMVTAIGSTVIGRGSDATGTIWWFWSLQHEGGYHLFGTTHHTLTGAPFGWNGQNGLNIQWLLPYYPAYLATKIVGPVAAHNLVLLSGYVLSGAAMYLLVRYLNCNRLVAAWAGLVYIVFPWHLERTPHASLVHLEFLPLLLLALLAAARRPSWARFSLVGAVTLACWLTSGYFGAMAIIGVVAFAIGVAFSKARRRIRLLLLGCTAGTLGASLIVGVLSEVSGVGRGSGLQRVASDLSVYGLRPVELVVPAAGNFVFGHWTRTFLASHQHHSNPTETSNYLGALTIALALTWLVLTWRRRATLGGHLRRATPGLTAVAVIALLLALPSPVSFFGHDIWMPSRVLWEIVPPFRVPSRWVVLAMAALVPLGALALQEAARRVSQVRLQWKAVKLAPVMVIVVAMVVSFLELGVNPAASRFSTKHVPAEYAALSQTPRGILAEYPLTQHIDDLFWQIFHGRPVMNTDAFGTPADDERRALVDPGAPGAAEQLSLLGVTAIVTHVDALAYAKGIPNVPHPNWGPGYRFIARAPDGATVWDVVAPAAPALVAAVTGFADPEPLKGGVVGYALTSPSGVGYLNIRAVQPSTVRLSLDAEPPKNQQRVLRLADASTQQQFTLTRRTHISLLVQVPRGFSLLFVKTDPAPKTLADAIVLSHITIAQASGAPELHPLLEASDPGF